MNFSENLKRLRISRNITQLELANFLHVSRPTIAGYETKNKQPDYTKLLMLSEYFNVSVDYLLTGKEDLVLTAASPFDKLDGISAKTLEKMLLDDFRSLMPCSQKDLVAIARLFRKRDQFKVIQETENIEDKKHPL